MGKRGGRLSIGTRRLIAVHVQYGKKKFAWLVRQGFTKDQIARWRDVPFTAPDEAFQDKPRGSPPVALSEDEERKLMRFLEKDDTYQEIIDVNGAGTHYMDDTADTESD